jgi:hypothetical protein
VDFDISFPEVSCSLLSLDAIDDSGNSQKDSAIHEMYKHRLSPTGEKQGLAERQDMGNTVQTEAELEQLTKEKIEEEKVIKEKIGSCGNCYGAGLPGHFFFTHFKLLY